MTPEVMHTAGILAPQLLPLGDPAQLLEQLGPWALAGMSVIVFIESGLLFPFLPGDSLLFTAGMLTRQADPFAPLWLVLVTAPLAAFLGDQVGYFIGNRFQDHLRTRPDGRIFKQAYLTEAHEFFDKWGPWAVVLARFVPIVRTFTPLVAGMAAMRYRTFVSFNVIGAIGWAAGVTALGSVLGDVPFIRDHIDLILLGIAAVSVLPIAIGALPKFLARVRRIDAGAPDTTAGDTGPR